MIAGITGGFLKFPELFGKAGLSTITGISLELNDDSDGTATKLSGVFEGDFGAFVGFVGFVTILSGTLIIKLFPILSPAASIVGTFVTVGTLELFVGLISLLGTEKRPKSSTLERLLTFFGREVVGALVGKSNGNGVVNVIFLDKQAPGNT